MYRKIQGRMMKWQPVESSNIKHIGYDPETQTLGVEFGNGKVFHYEGVSAAKHQDLMAAPSKGIHFNKHIKNAHLCKPGASDCDE